MLKEKDPIVFSRWLWAGISFALIVITSISLVAFHQMTAERTRSDVRDSLRSSAYDQTKLFTTMINDRLSTLDTLAVPVSQPSVTQGGGTSAYLQNIRDKGDYYRTWYMATDGQAYSNDGKTINISGLPCYESAMSGNSGVDYTSSLLNEERVYLLWVPILEDGNVKGALFAAMDESLFREKLVCAAYGDQSYSFVCDSKGNVVVGTENDQGAHLNDNLLDLLDKGIYVTGSREQLSQNLSDVTEGDMTYVKNGEEKYALYQPIGINDWMLVSVVNTAVISDSVNQVMSGFYVLSIAILLVAFAFMVVITIMNKRQKELLRFEAEHDALTGLKNRTTFCKQATRMIQKGAPGKYALCCFNVENFKVVNDQFGHDEGDRLLRAIGTCLRDDVEGKDAIVCRGSSDTFFVLIPNTGEHLRRALLECRGRLEDYDLPFRMVVRIGVCLVDDLTLDVDNLIDRAYLAQRTLKGKVEQDVAYYDDAVRQRILREQAMVEDMETALAERQFEVFFQPQYDLNVDKMVSAEALVRWRHPQKGLIPPGDFIPVFEQNGFISQLDAYVLESVCEYQRRWLDEGRTCVPLSVNISRVDMQDDGLCDKICALLEKYRLDSTMLRLEVTEGDFTENAQRSIDVVNALRERGLYVEMDDFGKGYFSLNSLKDIPVDMLKLDMRFLSSPGTARRGDVILGSIMDMARKLDLAVIAEGVETQEQADFLRSIGCSLVQGYLFARPMPAAEFEILLTDELVDGSGSVSDTAD